MATTTNGILTKSNINEMGPITTWSSNLNECVTFGDIYSISLLNVRMNDDSVSTDRTKLVRKDKIVKHFTRDIGGVKVNFKNKMTKEINFGGASVSIIIPNSVQIATGDWINTSNNTVTYSGTSFTMSNPLNMWSSGSGSSFDAFKAGITLYVSGNDSSSKWFVNNEFIYSVFGTYSIVVDNVPKSVITMYYESTQMTKSTNTNGTYKFTYSVTNFNHGETYKKFRDGSLTINIGVGGTY